MAETKFLNATQAWQEYSIPRSVLRGLSESGEVKRVERKLFSGKVMNLYSRKDIERYLNTSK